MKRTTLLLFAALTVLSLVVMPVVAAPADLIVSQPSWVESDASVDRSGDSPTYTVKGSRQEIVLASAPHSAVMDRGIVGGGDASLQYDARLDRYVFTADSDGTYELFWIVDDSATPNTSNNTTVSTRTRYTASLDVSQTDMVTIPAERQKELKSNVGRYEEVCSEFNDAAPDLSCEQALERGLGFVKFIEQPFGGFVTFTLSILLMLAASPQGWMLAGLILLAVGFAFSGLTREVHRLQRLFKDREDVEREKAELLGQRRRQNAATLEWSDVVGPDRAEDLRQHFGTPRACLDQLTAVLADTDITSLKLQLYHQAGYGLRWINRENGDYRLVENASDDEKENLIDPETARVIDPEDLPDQIYNHPDVDLLDCDALRYEESGDFAEQFDVEVGDGKDAIYRYEDDFVEMLTRLLRQVDDGPTTDIESGRVEPGMPLVDALVGAALRLRDQHHYPIRETARVLDRLSERDMDPTRQLDDKIEGVHESDD